MPQRVSEGKKGEKKLKNSTIQRWEVKIATPSLVINTIGALGALIGLAELIRLIISYWTIYGLLVDFPLKISIYMIGMIWIFAAFLNFTPLTSHCLHFFWR